VDVLGKEGKGRRGVICFVCVNNIIYRSLMLAAIHRFFIEIASDCETRNTSNHSLSFIHPKC